MTACDQLRDATMKPSDVGVAAASAGEAQLRRALLITSAFLQELAEELNVPETTSLTIFLPDEPIIGMTIGEALDLADAALAPKESTS